MRTRLLLIFLIVVLDQSTKHLFGGQINQGISFSWLQISPIILVLMQLVLLILVARTMRNHIAAGFILGGGISNILDRIFFGGVRDWMITPMLGLHNNLADWAIVFGLIWYGILYEYDVIQSYRK